MYYINTVQELESKYLTLRLILGIDGIALIEDFKTLVLDELLNNDLDSDIISSFKTAWDLRDEVKIAEIELFLAEMKRRQIRLDLLKNFSVSLGSGDFMALFDNEGLDINLKFSLSFPIVDFGDHRRNVEQSEIDNSLTLLNTISF